MRWHLVTIAVLCFSAISRAGISPPVSEISVPIPKLVAKSLLVCKGVVISAPLVKTINGPLPRMTGIATFRIDRCFKGTTEGMIHVAADEYTPAGGWGGGGHIFIPKTGEYLLLFLNRKGELYEIVDQNYGVLPVSAQTATAAESNDPITNLENDFKAGLSDPDPEKVLNSICWLGHLGHLQSTTELRSLLEKADPVKRAYLWEALLMVGDLSVLRDVGDYLGQHPPVWGALFLPQDRLLIIQRHLFISFCSLRDPTVIPYLERFAESPDPHTRVQAITGLRAIGDLSSAPVFLRALDDHHNDIDFIAMQSLFELAGGGAINWVPRFEDFSNHPDIYAAKCREWWRTEGEAKAKARAAMGVELHHQ
jgi:hypothetical protein